MPLLLSMSRRVSPTFPRTIVLTTACWIVMMLLCHAASPVANQSRLHSNASRPSKVSLWLTTSQQQQPHRSLEQHQQYLRHSSSLAVMAVQSRHVEGKENQRKEEEYLEEESNDEPEYTDSSNERDDNDFSVSEEGNFNDENDDKDATTANEESETVVEEEDEEEEVVYYSPPNEDDGDNENMDTVDDEQVVVVVDGLDAIAPPEEDVPVVLEGEEEKKDEENQIMDIDTSIESPPVITSSIKEESSLLDEKTEEEHRNQDDQVEESLSSTNSESGEQAEEEEETQQEQITDNTIEAPTDRPTEKPSEPPYFPGDDDPIRDQDEIFAKQEEVQDLEDELHKEERVARRAGGLGIFIGILAMIFTAHQMSENPDGIYASVCRLAITICSVVIKIVCMPCRKLLGAGNPHYHGHMPISTGDYSYRNDPYRSTVNAGFEMT
ncbi:hypothetical protein IV203_001818 [Nitzschia inconspicua]|uniref:Uncharacterized protein n=1 Tax=Nitzschia inconspicua TaxID=303405 RepID=A0A9K3PRE0_9STRA|nr:hypothetical protein IV203_001818 [Nitzschia inconspicua]